MRTPPALDAGATLFPAYAPGQAQQRPQFQQCTISIPPGHVVVMDATMLHAGAGSTVQPASEAPGAVQHSEVEEGVQRPLRRAEAAGWRFGGHAYTSGYFTEGEIQPETTTLAETALRQRCGVSPVREMSDEAFVAWVQEKLGFKRFRNEDVQEPPKPKKWPVLTGRR